MSSSEGPDLSDNKEPLQKCLLSCNPETNVSTDLGSKNDCVDLLESLGRTALQSGYDAWAYVEFQNKEKS